MLFSTLEFLFGYAPVVVALFFLIACMSGKRNAALFLVIASLFFYGWDEPYRLIPLIVSSIAVNYVFGRLLSRTTSKTLLVLGIVFNLALLGYFKYANFALDIAKSLGFTFKYAQVALPIGISFFTFTQIAFLVDAYRKEAREYNPVLYALFVTFFPHLIAGPILHHKEMMPQFEEEKTYKFNLSKFTQGLTWFVAGLVKKMLFADQISSFADPVFKAVEQGQIVGFLDAWIASISYAFQIYFDFSGYSDMAIGLALMMGIMLPLNFNSPYKATSLIDFWRRWHMTLSRFLRDYLYFPLGGNRKGPVRRYFNLLVTMLLGGLWHGATWNFIVWAGIHGVGLLLNHLWRGFSCRLGVHLSPIIGGILTFTFVVLAWVPFRAKTLGVAFHMWKAMVGLNGYRAFSPFDGFDISVVLYGLTFLFVVVLCLPNTQEYFSEVPTSANILFRSRWRKSLSSSIIWGVLLGGCVTAIILQSSIQFLYFRF